MSDLVVQDKKDLLTIAKSIKGVSITTRQNYIYAMQSYNKYLKKHRLKEGTKSLEQWVNDTPSPKTANSRLTSARRVLLLQFKGSPFLESVKEELSNIRPKKIDNGLKSYQYISLEEVQKVLKYAPEKLSLIIETLFTTGLRIHELVNMKYEQGKQDGKNYIFTFVGKGSKQGSVYIKKNLLDRIKKVFCGKVYLFEHSDASGIGKKYRREYLTRAISDITERAIGKRMSAHKMRHSYAMFLYEVKHLDLRTIQHALRHANVSTTSEIYLHKNPTADELEVNV